MKARAPLIFALLFLLARGAWPIPTPGGEEGKAGAGDPAALANQQITSDPVIAGLGGLLQPPPPASALKATAATILAAKFRATDRPVPRNDRAAFAMG